MFLFRILFVVFLGVLGFVLDGCPGLGTPDGCTPMAHQCKDGIPWVCSPSQRWTPMDKKCDGIAPGAMCCLTLSPYGRKVHACVPATTCIPEDEPADAGADQ